MNIVVFVGSRANLGRLESLIKELKNHLEFKVYVIGACTLDQVDHDIDLDYYIHADMYRDIYGNRAKSSSMITMSMIDWLGYYKMDMAICHGDRFETLGFAIACNYSKIPLMHMEAGDMSYIDNDTRWAITSLSSFHMATTFTSYARLKDQKIFNPYHVGSPIVDYILNNEFKVSTTNHHVLIAYNPTDPSEFEDFLEIIEILVVRYKTIKFIWINPNIDPGNKMIVSEILNSARENCNIEYIKNVCHEKYIELMANSICVIGNSSSGIREGCVLGVYNLLYGYRQGTREVFSNTYNFKCRVSFVNEFDNIITDYTLNGLHRKKYNDQLGKGDTCKKVAQILLEIGGLKK
jgi:UDP-N-acetylglucosamine 2-epimerase (non-hydrolysing)